MIEDKQDILFRYRNIQNVNLDILSFIYDILHHQKSLDSSEVIYTLFSNGYCYYFAKILEDAFPGGDVVWCAPYGHIAYQYNGIVYDIHYIYDGESEIFIPISFMGSSINDFRRIEKIVHNTTKDEINRIINNFKKYKGENEDEK